MFWTTHFIFTSHMGISQPTGMHYALTAPNFVCMQMTHCTSEAWYIFFRAKFFLTRGDAQKRKLREFRKNLKNDASKSLINGTVGPREEILNPESFQRDRLPCVMAACFPRDRRQPQNIRLNKYNLFKEHWKIVGHFHWLKYSSKSKTIAHSFSFI